MKKIKYLIVSIFLLGLCFDGFSQVVLSEDFSGGPTDYTTGSHTYDSGNIWELTAIRGDGEAEFQLSTAASITTPSINTVGTVSFQYKEGSSGGGNFQVLLSVDGGGFNQLDEQAFAGTSFSDYSVVVNNLSDNCKIKVTANSGSALIIDNFEITEYIEGAELLTNTPALSGFLYYEGEGPSTTKFFELSGSLLTGYPSDISITAPTNYEISLDDVSFFNSLDVPYSSANLSPTTIYVRLKSGLSLGDYNENITISGGGADDIFVSCTGSVTEMPPPAIYSAPGNLSGFSYVFGTGPSGYQTYQLYGNFLTDYPNSIAINAPSNYEVSLDNVSYSSSLSVSYDSYNLPSTTIYVRLKSGLAVGNYNNENITNVSDNYGTETVTCNGTVEDLPPDPTLYLSPSSLSGFSYILGNGPSAEQSYTLSGANLIDYPGDITVTAPTNYEISLSSGTGFTTSLLVPFTDANFSDEIYVRLKSGLSEGDYNGESITHNGGGASEVILSCSGTVDPIPPASFTVSSNSLSNFTYVVGNGPSAEQSFNLSGTYLTGYPDNITIEAPENYEISLSSGSDFSTQIILPYTSETLNITTIYVRLESGLPIGDYSNESIGITGGGADAESVLCSGNVTDLPPPVLSLTPTSLSGFSYILGNGPSAEQSYTLSGENLTSSPGNITVIAPTNYEISLSSGTGFSSSLLVPFADANVTEEIYVRLKSGLSEGDYNNETITHLGGGAWEVNLTCNGSVLPETTDPCLFEDFSGFTTGTHESPNSTDVSSSLDSYTLVSGWEGLKIFSANGEIKLGSSSTNGYIITPTIDLSAGGTLEFDHAKWSSDDPTVQVYHASDGINFIQVGSDISTTTDFQNHSIEITGGTASSKIKIAGTERIYLDNIEVYCGGLAPTPILTANPTSLNGFNYTEGSGPSAEQEVSLTGSDLDASDVIITPSTNYEVSLISGTGFQSTPINLGTFDGNALSLFIRLKSGLTANDYNLEIISIAGAGSEEVTITCSGTVDELPTPMLTVSPTSLTGFYYTEGSGPSNEQSFVVSGTDLDGTNVIVTPPENYQISEIPTGGFQSSAIVLSAFNGADRSIFVRLKEGLDVGTYNSDLITISGGGAADITVNCNGYVEELLTPELSVNPETINGFSYIFENGPSMAQSFELSGIDLDDSQLNITPPENYEISLSESSGYSSNPIVLNSFDGNPMSVYVRLKADLPVGNYNDETINISGSGAVSISVTCSGYVEDNVNINQFTDESIQIYPNPVNHVLFVELAQNVEHFTWTLCDITGRVFNSGQESELDKTLQIDISDLQSGLYVLILTDGNHQLTRKIEKL